MDTNRLDEAIDDGQELLDFLTIGTRIGYELEAVKLHPQTFWTEATQSRLFATHYQDVLRSLPEQTVWFVWSGHHWELDVTGQVDEHVKDYVHDLYREHSTADKDTQRLARGFLTKGKITAVKALASTERNLVVTVDALDRAEHKLATPSGTINLRTGKLQRPNPQDLITKVTNATYKADLDPYEAAPQFMQFLDDITDGDKELQAHLQRCFGYMSTGSVKEHLLWIFYGIGGNGKDTLLNAIKHALGDYVGEGAPVLLVYDAHGSKHPTEIADLQGMRLAIHSEMENGQQMAEAKVKMLTGSNSLKARRLYKDFMSFPNVTKHVLHTNHLPIIQGDDYAMRRRLLVVPFTRQFEGEQRDNDLEKKLQREASGILAWIVQGAQQWYQDGLGQMPAVVREATQDYLRSHDPVGQFLDDCLAITNNSGDFLTNVELRAALAKWANPESRGTEALLGDVTGLEHKLRTRLKALGCEATSKNMPKTEDGRRPKVRGWTGVQVKS